MAPSVGSFFCGWLCSSRCRIHLANHRLKSGYNFKMWNTVHRQNLLFFLDDGRIVWWSIKGTCCRSANSVDEDDYDRTGFTSKVIPHLQRGEKQSRAQTEFGQIALPMSEVFTIRAYLSLTTIIIFSILAKIFERKIFISKFCVTAGSLSA